MSSTITALTSGGGLAMAGDTSGQLQLLTNNGTAAVTIDTSQNVGVGTSSPASKLDVKAGSGSVISRSTSGVNFKAFYDDGRTTYTSVNYDGISTSGAQDFYLASGSNFYLRTNTNSSLVTAMYVNTSGAVGIGSTDIWRSGEKLAVYANADVSYFWSNGAGGAINLQSFWYGAGKTYVGSITTSGSSTSYASASDYRLKENVASMTGALAKVSLLKPVTYKWKSDGKDGQGFIAHELQEVCPDAVCGEKDAVDEEGNPVYQGVDTSFLIATLTAAIQELNAKVEAQALEIQALKGVA